ncbi:MAG: AsnC family transcriptional regulator [Candidatus Micrarchaeota archaeon]
MPKNLINTTETVKIPKIDLKDRKIIRELDMNARMGIKELAKRVGLSRQVVQYRLERMKKEGLLLGAFTIFDSAVVGQRWFRIILQLNKINKAEKEKFIEYLKNHPSVFWAGEVGGNWDFIINFIVEDQFSFNKIFEKFLEEWGKFVQRYEVLTYINVTDQARQYLLPDYEVKRTEFFHEMKYDAGIRLDELDKGIISLLSNNAWLSALEIGNKLKVNYKTIQNRIKLLEKNNVILGYRIWIHPRKLGYETHVIFFGINSYRPELEKQLVEFLKHPNVTFVVKHLGLWRIGIEVEVSSSREFQDFLVELRTRFGEIISTYETFPIFHDHVLNYFPRGALK